MKKLLIAGLLASASLTMTAQIVTPAIEQKAKEIVSQMTLEEKIDYIGGYNGFYIRAIDRLGLPQIRMADASTGVRNDTKSTMYPASICTAATFNRDIAYSAGTGVAMDCRTRDVQCILGPGMNIYRSAMCGRNFEYLGEDPYLAGEQAAAWIKGVQDNGVIATAKHYATNYQEWSRHLTSSDVDERTLQEIYLPAFRKSVMKGGVSAVMNSYNLLNGQHATENVYLNKTVLREQFGFKGILMSDWNACYSILPLAQNGMDLEMPSGLMLNRKNLMPLIQNGILDVKDIDQKCEHIVQTILSYNFGKDFKLDRPMDDPESAQKALDCALEGIVLLKNEANVLPLKGKTLVIGPKADALVRGGGSSEVTPLHNVTPVQAFTAMNKKQFSTAPTPTYMNDIDASAFQSNGKQGFTVQYFNNDKMTGKAAATLQQDALNMGTMDAPVAQVGKDHFSLIATSTFTSPIDGDVRFHIEGDDGYRLYINGKLVAHDWSGHSTTMRDYTMKMKKGDKADVKIEYYDEINDAVLRFAAQYKNETDAKTRFAELAKGNDNIVLCIGLGGARECEGSDRPWALDDYQKELIEGCASTGKKVVVVLYAGGNVGISEWIDKVDGLIMAWYPGQEGGRAIADIATGKVCPSGRLPITIERKWEDSPCYDSYHTNVPQPNGTAPRVQFTEGIFMGYRGFDKSGIAPLYPFGFGLSYTSFAYSNLQVEKKGADKMTVSFDVKNTGKVAGKEVCQLYVQDVECSVQRPAKELKGYEKVSLKKGETKRVSIDLDAEAFSFYDVNSHKFIIEPGEFRILVGGSSQDLPLSGSVTL